MGLWKGTFLDTDLPGWCIENITSMENCTERIQKLIE